jgi:outer membrane protein assembly factor BamB
MRIIAALAACALVPALSIPAQADDWPQFRGNPRLTGVATSQIPKTLKVLWSFEAGDVIESSPAIANGVVYQGVGNGDVVALDLEAGRLKWRYKSGVLFGESSAAVADGVVYIGDLEGGLHAINAADGKKLWVFKAATEIKSSPVVTGGRVLVGSYDQSLYALDARTGKQLWSFATSGPVHATPGVIEGVTFVAGCDEHFRAIRIADGKEVYAIHAQAYIGASPALAPGEAYFGTFDNQVLGLDLNAKKVVWRYENPTRKFPFYSSPALKGDRIWVGGRDKNMYCINTKTGKPLWTFAARARIESSPALASAGSDTRVLFGSNDGRFYMLNADTGAKLWEFEAGSPLSASPAVSNGKIVIGAQDGKVYCFGD